jgi:hypothetical protein
LRRAAELVGGAELEMQLSLTRDLIPLGQFLATLREEGGHKVATLLERGD